MICALVQGALASEPVRRTAASGSPFWTCNLRVPAGTESIFLGLSTFSETAGARLMALHKGSALAAAGVLEQATWSGRDGAVRVTWRLTANEILSPYLATKRRKAVAPAEPPADSRSIAKMWAAESELPESDL